MNRKLARADSRGLSGRRRCEDKLSMELKEMGSGLWKSGQIKCRKCRRDGGDGRCSTPRWMDREMEDPWWDL